jgi:hypothetical protein
MGGFLHLDFFNTVLSPLWGPQEKQATFPYQKNDRSNNDLNVGGLQAEVVVVVVAWAF